MEAPVVQPEWVMIRRYVMGSQTEGITIRTDELHQVITELQRQHGRRFKPSADTSPDPEVDAMQHDFEHWLATRRHEGRDHEEPDEIGIES